MFGHPEYLYYAAMLLIALPIGFRNMVSAIIFMAWLTNKALYELGAPEPQTYLTVYLIAFALAAPLARRAADLFAAILFAPLALTCAFQLIDVINDTQAWWTIFWIALTQAASLPFSIDWQAARERWRARTSEGGGQGMLRVAHA